MNLTFTCQTGTGKEACKMLELDKRIKDKTKIFNLLLQGEASLYIGHKGYFANSLCAYKNLRTTNYGTLSSVENGFELFHTLDDNEIFEYFLPEGYVDDMSLAANEGLEGLGELDERLRDIETDFPSALEHIEDLERSLTSLSARVELLEGILYYRRQPEDRESKSS